MKASRSSELEDRMRELEQSVRDLQAEVAELRRARQVAEAAPAYVAARDIPEIRPAVAPPPALPPGAPPVSAGMESVVAEWYADGFLVLPPSQMREIAARWEARPEEEKRALTEELRSLRLDPPLSGMIHLMRGGWYPDLPGNVEADGG